MRRRASLGEPSQPTQPEKPTTPDTPATGDSSNVTALWVVLAAAGVGIIVLVVLRIRRTKLHREKALRPVWAAGLSCPRLCRRGGDFAPPEPFPIVHLPPTWYDNIRNEQG